MYFRFTTVLALLSAPLAAFAANPNPFKIPADGLAASAGTPLNLQWTPTTSGTVTLILRSGSSNNLNQGTVIASSIQNSGSYTWTPTNAFTRGSDYAIEIVDDSDPTQTNYTPYFVLDTSNTVASTTPTVTMGAVTTTMLKTQTNAPTPTTMKTTASDSTASSSSAATTETAKTTVTTGSSSASTSGASSSGGSPTSSGSSAASSSSGTPGPAATGGASRASAAMGMLGVVALGALAL